MQVNVHEAKTHLSRLLEAAARGEDVVIARDNEPFVRLVPIRKPGFRIGIMADVLKGPGPDFFEPMSEEDLRLWEGGD